MEIIICKIILPPSPPCARRLRPAEEERRVGEQEEEGGEPGHLARALGRQLQPVGRRRRLLHQRRDGLGHAQPLQRGEATPRKIFFFSFFLFKKAKAEDKTYCFNFEGKNRKLNSVFWKRKKFKVMIECNCHWLVGHTSVTPVVVSCVATITVPTFFPTFLARLATV